MKPIMFACFSKARTEKKYAANGKNVAIVEWEKLLTGDFVNTLIENRERFSAAISMAFAKLNLEHGIVQRRGYRFPIFTQHQKVIKCLNHGMEPAYHFEGTQLMRRHHFQGASTLPKHWNNNNPSDVKFSLVAIPRGFFEIFSCFYQLLIGADKKGRNCRSSAGHHAIIRFGEKASGMCILPAHHEYRHSQCSDGADRLNPARPAIFRQACIVANEPGNYRSRHQSDTKKYMGFLHECIQSCLKGILA
ncbi:hypothetical protein C8C92_3435 [Janthinobacterium sp. 78]|nr:hypothetical protein C8C92_3435 [Janthinobacterium sp. 78]